MNGTVLGVYHGGVLIAHATECSISMSMDTRDASTKDSGGYRDLLEGARSGSISVSALYEDLNSIQGVDDLMTNYAARSGIQVRFSTAVSGDHYWSALAYLTSLELSASKEDNVTYSASFELTGAITYGTTV